eukprot:CAMPEP_0194378548 /NCGR_PEP_ID=MMETSP0174-20130528/36028_1 /TAXON_ID=216777 /ORGANISM="Proboscia alata, Strain PI-D3" /LENGTH=187 /DNA_ID=CAMNT_0039160663 /DNA_START=36 /DNA_END=596 /DNA_ORIENTATION=-
MDVLPPAPSVGGPELQLSLHPILEELERKGHFGRAHANESDGGPVTLFACPVPEHEPVADPRAALMGVIPHWDRSSGKPIWVALDLSPDDDPDTEAFLTVSESLDVAEVARRWVGEVDEEYGCSEEDVHKMRQAVGLLNEASTSHGTCFEFARPGRASDCESVYTVGVGCVCADGTLVGWRQDNVVW